MTVEEARKFKDSSKSFSVTSCRHYQNHYQMHCVGVCAAFGGKCGRRDERTWPV